MFFKNMAGKSHKIHKENTCRTIGIAGSRRGVGVTHFCICGANYLSGCMGKRTAVLEWNSHKDFQRIERVCTGKNKETGCFSLLNVSYYKDAGSEELAECIEAGFQYVIVDFGVYGQEKKRDLLCLRKRVLIGSFTEWQEEEFLSFLYKSRSQENGWIYGAVFGSREAGKEVRKKLKVPVLQIPYAPDAFSVTSELLPFFREFFED